MCICKCLGMALAMLLVSATVMAAIVPSESSLIASLNGKWRFKLEQAITGPSREGLTHDVTTPETFEAFYLPDYKEDADWHDLDVPGNWEMAGYSPATYWNPDNASGFYRKWIDIPASWTGRVVKINFDGVQNGAEVWLNGKPVPVTEPSWGRTNYHESGWTAWQADLSLAVKFGERNLLALRVTKNTQSSNLDSGDYYFLGGVYRPVTLFTVPQTHIADFTVQTRLLPGNKAEVKVIVDVTAPTAASPNIEMQLEGLDSITAQATNGRAELVQIVSKPRLWSAEQPNLYGLTITLHLADGKPIEHVKRRVGIREVTIKDGVLLVNGVPVKLTGICRHDVSPSEGTAVGEALWRKDLTLMKAANINAVRTSHYPYGSGFYDLCDEMGFYVLDELPYCWCPTDTGALTPAYEQRARETVARDKNHACVIVWAIGNENKPGRNLQVVADLVKALDPTRPRLVSEMPADKYGVEFDDAHYTPPPAVQKAANDRKRRAIWPKIYTENPNVWDTRFGADYGCLDLWAEVFRRSWDVVWKSDGIPGLFLWEWQDRAVADKCPTKLYQYDPATGIGYMKTKGIVDGNRNPRPEYYHLKMVQSPIVVAPKIDLKSQPGSAILSVTNRYSFTDISAIKTKWQVLKNGKRVKSGTAPLRLAPRTSGSLTLKLPEGGDTLRVDFDDPRGWNVVGYQFALAKPKVVKAMDSKLPEGLAFPWLNMVSKVTVGDPATWVRIYRSRYDLNNIDIVPVGPPTELAFFMTDKRTIDADIVCSEHTIVPECPAPTAEQRAKITMPAVGEIVGRVHAEFANGEFSYRIDWTGPKADIEELGWVFDMPKAFDHFSWKRQALWSVYPETHIGRPQGTALPDTMNVHLTNITRPDAFDFNSTKYNCDWATLTDAKGRGLRVEFAAKQRYQVRGGVTPTGRYELVVNKQCSPPRDISSNCVPDLYLELSPGKQVEGTFKVGSNKTQ